MIRLPLPAPPEERPRLGPKCIETPAQAWPLRRSRVGQAVLVVSVGFLASGWVLVVSMTLARCWG